MTNPATSMWSRVLDCWDGLSASRQGVLMITLAVSIVAAVTASLFARINLVILNAMFDHPYAWGFVALYFGVFGLCRAVPWDWFKVLVVVMGVVVALMWALGGWWFWPARTVAVVDAPNGRGYELHVQDVGVMDEEYVVSIRQTDGWIDWEYQVDCGFASLYDPPDEGGTNPWDSSGSRLVVVDYFGDTIEVPVDVDSGHPGPCTAYGK